MNPIFHWFGVLFIVGSLCFLVENRNTYYGDDIDVENSLTSTSSLLRGNTQNLAALKTTEFSNAYLGLSKFIPNLSSFASFTGLEGNPKDNELSINQHRRLQFEGMFEQNADIQQFNKKGSRGRKKSTSNNSLRSRFNRAANLAKAVEEIVLNMDRYHMWWTGPTQNEGADSDSFRIADWSIGHNNTANAIFTMAVVPNTNTGRSRKITSCSSPNDLLLFFGTARRTGFTGDLVVALEADTVTLEIKNILKRFRVVVYLLPTDLCSSAKSVSVFCGSQEERVPASAFRYYFYEKWANLYSSTSLVLLADFRDVIFQSDPFTYLNNNNRDWLPTHQLVLYQEFHPNMVIERSSFDLKILQECYGDEALRALGSRVVLSSGALMGTRDAVLLWSHHITLQLQEAPGRLLETRCTGTGIEHAFLHWLIYHNKLSTYLRIRVIAQGEGAVNSIGGLHPQYNLTVHHTHSLLPPPHEIENNNVVAMNNRDQNNALSSSTSGANSDQAIKGLDRRGNSVTTRGLHRSNNAYTRKYVRGVEVGRGRPLRTVAGSLRGFWGILSDDGFILNWNGEVSPVVHQLDHFVDELQNIADALILAHIHNHSWPTTYSVAGSQTQIQSMKTTTSPPTMQTPQTNEAMLLVAASFDPSLALNGRLTKPARVSLSSSAISSSSTTTAATTTASIDAATELLLSQYIDRSWQSLAVTQCLWGCVDSEKFS